MRLKIAVKHCPEPSFSIDLVAKRAVYQIAIKK